MRTSAVWGYLPIAGVLSERGLTPTAVLTTHGYHDHSYCRVVQ